MHEMNIRIREFSVFMRKFRSYICFLGESNGFSESKSEILPMQDYSNESYKRNKVIRFAFQNNCTQFDVIEFRHSSNIKIIVLCVCACEWSPFSVLEEFQLFSCNLNNGTMDDPS